MDPRSVPPEKSVKQIVLQAETVQGGLDKAKGVILRCQGRTIQGRKTQCPGANA